MKILHPHGLLPLFLLTALAPACYQAAAVTHVTSGADHAEATLVPIGGSGVSGQIRFVRTDQGVRVTGRIEGLSPGKHGFHVHQYGDVSDTKTGASAGGHFAPEGHDHGAPREKERHVGDLGNIEADSSGVAEIDLLDSVIALAGPSSIIGRAVVVHEGEDVFTQPSGDAGGRIAFGVIGLASKD